MCLEVELTLVFRWAIAGDKLGPGERTGELTVLRKYLRTGRLEESVSSSAGSDISLLRQLDFTAAASPSPRLYRQQRLFLDCLKEQNVRAAQQAST